MVHQVDRCRVAGAIAPKSKQPDATRAVLVQIGNGGGRVARRERGSGLQALAVVVFESCVDVAEDHVARTRLGPNLVGYLSHRHGVDWIVIFRAPMDVVDSIDHTAINPTAASPRSQERDNCQNPPASTIAK